MLIARAPVRISFAGGGTDLEAYYAQHGGMVVSTTIDKYFYVIVNVNDAEMAQITSADYQTFYRYQGAPLFPWDGDLALPRAILHHYGIQRGLSMFLASEIPPGTGLGSSSTVAVAIIKALSTLCDQPVSRGELAELATYIEIQKLAMPIGKQDQYAAAFGGLNAIAFTRERVVVEPVRLTPETRRCLERNILLFFTGAARDSADILSRQRKASHSDAQVIESLHALKAMAAEVRDCFERGDLARFGEILAASWEQKKRLAQGITNPRIDECYEVARVNGALGGKITGAGGGGFLMLYCEPEYQAVVTTALEARDLRRMDFRFENSGARVLLNAGLKVKR